MSRDSKSIYLRQNERGMIDAQKVASHCYSLGKRLTIFLALILILFPVGVNIFVLFIDNATVNAILSVLSFVLLVIAEIIRWQIKKAKFNGAEMQQYFDEYVFSLNNTCKKYLPPSKRLTLTERSKLYNKYKDKSAGPYRNWYADYSALPYEQAVYQCQKENIGWDLSIRKKYRIFLMIVVALLGLLIIINAILQRMEISSLILVISSIFPLFSYFISSFKKLSADITAWEKLYSHIEKIENEIKCEKEICDEIEELQVEIFSYRQKAYLIPNWFYKMHRKKLQDFEDSYAKMICEYKKLNDEEKKQ